MTPKNSCHEMAHVQGVSGTGVGRSCRIKSDLSAVHEDGLILDGDMESLVFRPWFALGADLVVMFQPCGSRQ